jgi:hypothetical protein
MALSVLNGDYHINGTLSSALFNAPSGSIRNIDIEQDAQIEASKLVQPNQPTYRETVATTASTLTIPLHSIVGTTATLNTFVAGMVVPNIGDSTVSVDLLKNGSTVLTAPISLSSADAARAQVTAAITDFDAVVGDLYEVDIIATIGTGTLGLGLFVFGRIYELAL